MPLGAFKAALMGTAGVSTGDVVLLSSQTASNSATISFTSDITSTYGEYIFRFYNINPVTDSTEFQFQCNATDSTSYDETMTTNGDGIIIKMIQEARSEPVATKKKIVGFKRMGTLA